MYETLAECPLCNSGNISNYLVCKDHSISQEEFALAKCNDCNLIFTNPRPVEEQIQTYYQSDEYISHQNKSTNPVNILYKIARQFTLRNKYKLISKNTIKDRLLDIGCGTGHFLTYCKTRGWKPTGIEPSTEARSHISSEIEIHSDLKHATGYFEAITMWHVLEHVHQVNEYLERVKALLTKTGTLFVAVPNINSWDAKYYGSEWAALDVPRHLYHFNQATMTKLLKKHNMKVTGIVPMKLDAYYVSLLSEKYQTGKSNYLKSFINGYKSNSYARKNDNEYSSLIYIIRKK